MFWVNGGIEGAIHSLRDIYEDKANEGYGVLLVDAKNAFNSVIRNDALWNVRVLWPHCSHFIFNPYQGFSSL